MAKYCMFCGEELPDTAQFCPSCGKKQNAEPKHQMVKDEPDSDDEIDLLLKYGMMNSQPKKEQPVQRVIKIDSPIDELLSGSAESEQKEEYDSTMDLIQSYIEEPSPHIQAHIEEPEPVPAKEEFFVADEPEEKEILPPDPEPVFVPTIDHDSMPAKKTPVKIPMDDLLQKPAMETKMPEDTDVPFSDEQDEKEKTAVQEPPAQPAPAPFTPSRKRNDDFVFTDDEDDEDEDFGLIVEEEEKEETPKPTRRQAARRDVTVKRRSISVEEAEDDFNTDISTASGGGINFDSEKMHADEILEREKRKNAVIEDDDGDRSSLEGRTANKQKQTKRRQSQRNYNDKKIYEIEHDRSEIDENEDPDYDGYYENVLPVDYDRDVKKNIDWKTIGIVFGFIGFIALFIFIFVTYLI